MKQLFRGGHYERDPVTPPNPEIVPNTICPDCGCEVSCGDVDHTDSNRKYWMCLHRISSCSSTVEVANWYHEVAVRLAPTERMVAAVNGARVAKPLWAAGNIDAWELSCITFLRHLLTPMAMLVDDDQLHPMLYATRLFLTTLDADVTNLPDADDFGPVPALPFLHATLPGGAAPLSLNNTF